MSSLLSFTSFMDKIKCYNEASNQGVVLLQGINLKMHGGL